MNANNFHPKGFEPGPNHVIIGRGRQCYTHDGNLKLRKIVASRIEEYSASTTKKEKSQIICSIIEQVQGSQPSGSFIKHSKDHGCYYDVGHFLSSDKISQTFRDFLRGDYKSSNAYKKSKLRRQKMNTVVLQSSPNQVQQRIDQYSALAEPKMYALSSMNGGQKKRPRFEATRPSSMPIEFNQAIEYIQRSQTERIEATYCHKGQSPALFTLPTNRALLRSQPAFNKEKINELTTSIAFRRTSLGANPLEGLSHIATNVTMISNYTKTAVVSSDESASDSSTVCTESKRDNDSDFDDSSSCEELDSDIHLESSKEDQWRMKLAQLETFYKKNRFDCVSPRSNRTMCIKIAKWIEEQRQEYLNFYEGRRTSMTAMQVVQLEKLGVSIGI